MKQMIKKLACVAVAFAMIVPAAGCKKKTSDSDEESSGVVSAAEEILDALTSLNMKKLKKIDAFSDCLEDLEVLAGCEPITKMMKKASFEIDEDSVSEKKKNASCDATITLPDYEEAVDEADGDPEAFIEAVEAQKEKKYKSVDVTLEFDVDDDEYTLSNGQELAAALYEDIFDNVLSSFGDPNTDPDPTDTEPTDDPNPTDDPTEPTDTKDPTTTTPANTSEDEVDPIDLPELHKATLNEDVFTDAVRASDSAAANNISETEDSTVKKYLSAYANDFSVMYMYYQYNSAAEAKEYYSSFSYMKDSADIFVMEDDWGYITYRYSDWSYFIYYSDDVMFYCVGLNGDAETIEKVKNFALAIG